MARQQYYIHPMMWIDLRAHLSGMNRLPNNEKNWTGNLKTDRKDDGHSTVLVLHYG